MTPVNVPFQLEPSFNDPNRLCPMPAGPALLEGTRWTVRMSRGDATVEAPRALIERVAKACDGTKSLAQILEDVRPTSMRARVHGLVSDLLDAGVLVDATLYTVTAQRTAWIPSPFGNAAEREVWQQVPRRFAIASNDDAEVFGPVARTPLDSFVNSRRSVRTYGEHAPDEASLRAYLWLLGGVVQASNERAAGPRRTIPSGGAVHSLRPMVVLRRQVGDWPPGVYDVLYPAERRVDLRRRSDDAQWLPRAVLHPRYLGHATGMVFLVGDPRLGAIKYRARALQYMFIEAGAALQNAALATEGLGLAMSVYGGYVETFAGLQLGLDEHDVLVASAMFGTLPTPEQERLAAQSVPMEFNWANSESPTYTTPYHVARCNLLLGDSRQVESWGRDRDPWMAYTKSLVESIERMGFRTPQRVVEGRYADFDDVLDPRRVIRYADVQYRAPDFGLVPFDEQRRCGWVLGHSVARDAATHVLAELVYTSKSLRERIPGAWAAYTECNSSGCAAHLDDDRALEAALFELIERDAYMRSWLSQRAGVELSARSIPAELRQRVRTLQSLGCRVSMQRLPSRWAPVCVVYAQHEALHFTVVGAAARSTLAEAAAAALDEMETLAYVNLNEPRNRRLRPREVKAPVDHSLLYSSPRYFRRADALLQTERPSTFAKAAAASDIGRPVVDILLDAGCEVVVVDIAAPGSSIDQGRTPVSVLRAIVPDLLPISFGYGREPLGSVASFDPRGRFPHPFP